jgi:Tol biopolymer transport system component
MSNRHSALVLIAALASCFMIAACVALGIGGYLFYLSFGNSVAPFGAPSALNRVAFVGNDFNIYVADPVSGATTALTRDGGDEHAYNYPTWSPDNHRLAFVGYTFQDGNPKEGSLYTVAPDGARLTTLYKTESNFPFYLYWSPNSQIVSFLANKDAQTIALNIARTDQPDSKQEVDSGSPFYWAWSPDGSQMFTHVGGTRAEGNNARLALLTPQPNNAPQSLSAAPGTFQAPQWSRKGKVLYSTLNGSEQAIALSDAQGNEPKTLATYRGRASFALSPDDTSIAYLLTETPTRLAHFGPVRVVDATGENVRVVSQDPALAFLWSPDSAKLAYLTVDIYTNDSNFDLDSVSPARAATAPERFSALPRTDQEGEPRLLLHWHIWDRAANSSRIVASFTPTLSFLNVLPYFDQYANSSTFWSPDSRELVYTANEGTDRGAVYVADAVGSAPPRKIGEGVLAFWSWK